MPPGSGWRLVFGNDFNEASLDPAKWPVRQTIPAGRESGNIYLENGELVIKIEASGHPAGVQWGWIHTNTQRFGRGYFECRAKMPDSGEATWPAFWIATDAVSGDANFGGPLGESDIFEWVSASPSVSGSARTRQYLTYHNWDPSHTNQSYPYDGPDFSTGYYTYGMEWGKGFVKWYIDDVLVATHDTTPTVEYKPGRVVLQSQSDYADTWPGPVGQTTVHPHYFRVDWVKIWQNETWHGYQRLQTTGLTAQQQTDIQNAIRRCWQQQGTCPWLRSQLRTLAAQDYLVEVATDAEPTKAEWVSALYMQISGGLGRAGLDTALTLTPYAGADWEARRLACKAVLGL